MKFFLVLGAILSGAISLTLLSPHAVNASVGTGVFLN